jgi:tetratricopeptide (TPR) repeat protein
MHVNHQVEPAPPQAPRQADIVDQPGEATPAFHDQDVVQMRVAGDDRRGIALYEIGECRVGECAPQCPNHRRREYHVADEAEADEEDVHGSRFDSRLVQQHDGNIILDPVDALALRTLERRPVLDEVHLRLALRAGEYFQQFRVDRHAFGSAASPARLRPVTAGVIIVMKMQRTVLVLLLATLAWPARSAAQPAAAPGVPDATYYFLLGRHYESTGDIAKAVASHKQAIAVAPDSAELRAELAGLYARQDRDVEAVEMAEEALKRDARNREANRTIGTIYAALADKRRALRPGDNPSQYVARAIQSLERAREDGGSEPSLDLTLGQLYLQTEAYDKAIPLLRRVTTEQPGYPNAAMLLATAEEAAGRTADAIGTLQRALEENPQFLRGYVMLAELNEKQGRWDDAAAAYARAQQLSTRIDLTTRRAAALINAGKAAAARDLLKTGAAKPDAEPLLLYLYAAAQRQTGDLEGAETTARRLRTSAPEDPRGMYVLAQVLEARGDMQGAERSLRDLLQRDPKDATALNYLGYMFAERGQRLDEAVDLVQRALKIDPGNPSFLDSLGWAYYQQGKLDLADPALTEAAAKMPNNSVIQEHLGDLRFKQQRFADAAAAWERSLNGDGEAIDRTRIQKKIQDARSRMEGR